MQNTVWQGKVMRSRKETLRGTGRGWRPELGAGSGGGVSALGSIWVVC